jgi:DNA polymerase elongation subunit (family B)
MLKSGFDHTRTEIFHNEIILFGRTQDDKSVAVRIQDHKPFVILTCPGYKKEKLGKLLEAELREHVLYKLNTDLFINVKTHQIDLGLEIEEVKGKSITNADKEETFFKISVKDVDTFTCLNTVLKGRYAFVYHQTFVRESPFDKIQVGEADTIPGGYTLENVRRFKELSLFVQRYDEVKLETQYFVQHDLQTCSTFFVEGTVPTEKITTCDVELIEESLRNSDPVDIPLKTLTYDIETLFDPSDRDREQPIITIGALLNDDQFVWVLGDEPVEGLPDIDSETYHPEKTTVYDFTDEILMLENFFDFIRRHDPDVIQGHNVDGFDNPYIVKRFKSITGVYPTMGRFKDKQTTVSAYKMTETVRIAGRVILDSCSILQKDRKEPSYKLDDLALKYLKEKKIDCPYEDIRKHFETKEGRTFLATYCVKDSWLSHKLLRYFNKLTQYYHMANMTSLGLDGVLGGQGAKTYALLYRECKGKYFLPHTGKIAGKFEGAKMETIPGLYTTPTIALDFASLYPSVIIAFNMCYSTIAGKSTSATKTVPETDCHFNQSRKGIFPELLKRLLKQRKAVKKQMKGVSGLERLNLDAKQTAIKLICNASYGFLSGYYICDFKIAGAVTAAGRYCRQFAQDYLEQRYGRQVYSHTDSVYINLNENVPIDECHARGETMAAEVTKEIGEDAIKLEYEETICPMLIGKKGQAAGIHYEPGGKGKRKIKGFKATRLDTIPIEANLQKNIVDLILDGKSTEIESLFKKEYERVRSGGVVLSEITCRKKLGKDLEKYASKNSSAVQVALRMKEQGDNPKKGDFVEFIIAEGQGPKYKRAVGTNVPDVKPDYDGYAIELLSVIKQILPNEAWVKSFGKKRKRCINKKKHFVKKCNIVAHH